ncbi:uncharacterized protein Z519_03605 [Cladophialophora bantiana CBS 173.52]|uniref:Ig-like domain-containing protein n=1 Tax=Cladophialophora bantiana (strain ATCC 10958 / CBS 173.52 / CDC B-1940 / NIH 8579) TaxID=1442370 RepID=A0A0D2IE40_CLAB1|nr:uncharacterized protein Z519_03605 [Cladophialophora bantiana CBS 173.52]KIW95024.1 hypothetical protein Z519_03605 [Cladophialophora bantiana CBS 173.52]
MGKTEVAASSATAVNESTSPASSSIRTRIQVWYNSVFWVVSLLFLSLGWLACIIALLVLNFKGYIAGASASCGVRSCNDNPWSQNWQHTTDRLDKSDHNILGALQLVAKALEIWFIFLAGSLMLDLTMLLARNGDGLPFRCLVLPSDFGELMSFKSPSLWKSPLSPRTGSVPLPSTTGNTRRRTIYLLITFAALLSIVCNLMGPATAVLLLPTLGWRTITVPEYQQVVGIGASKPPGSSEILTCSSTQMADGQYSCLQGGVGDLRYITDESINFQSLMRFSFNITGTVPALPIIPSRQTLNRISIDFNEWSFSGEQSNFTSAAEFAGPGLTSSMYRAFRNAQQVIRRRQAPGYLFSCDCMGAFLPSSVTQITAKKYVRCFDFMAVLGGPSTGFSSNVFENLYPVSYTIEGSPISTMCIRTGPGWSHSENAHAQFYLANSSSTPVTTNVYSSDRAIYLNSSNYECPKQSTTSESASSPCDWDALFATEPTPLLRNVSMNPLITEYIFSDDSTTSWCSSFVFPRLATYVFDTSPITNPFSTVTMEDEGPLALGGAVDPIYVDPNWILAAWNVDRNGTLSNEQAFVGEEDFIVSVETPTFASELSDPQSIIVAQSLSLIDYTLQPASPDSAGVQSLVVNFLVHVWSYGLDSRTSKVGVTIAIAGCVVALAKIVVGLATRTVSRDNLDFIMKSLEQSPPPKSGAKSFHDLDEKIKTRVRFMMENEPDAEIKVGKF